MFVSSISMHGQNFMFILNDSAQMWHSTDCFSLVAFPLCLMVVIWLATFPLQLLSFHWSLFLYCLIAVLWSVNLPLLFNGCPLIGNCSCLMVTSPLIGQYLPLYLFNVCRLTVFHSRVSRLFTSLSVQGHRKYSTTRHEDFFSIFFLQGGLGRDWFNLPVRSSSISDWQIVHQSNNGQGEQTSSALTRAKNLPLQS